MLTQCWRRIAAASALLVLSSCSRQAPLTTVSSDQAVFAEAYPARLEYVRTAFEREEKTTRSSFSAVRTLHGRVQGAEPEALREVISHADATGRSSHYADTAAEQELIERFFATEGAAVRRRVAGSVTSSLIANKAAAAQGAEGQPPASPAAACQCSTEEANSVAGRAAASVDRAVKQRLEERLAQNSEVQRFIAERAEQLGRRNLPVLEEEATTLARASYITQVRLEQYRRELEALLEQSSAVQQTLERDLAETRAELTRTDLDKTQRAALERRVAASEAARAALDAQLPLATPAVENMPQRRDTLGAEYQSLLEELKQTAQPSAPDASKEAAGDAADRNRDISGTAR